CARHEEGGSLFEYW
nr:immunoglobulin heavy chain junction region [Macaca mulatta]MOW85727.1 immunoglobulin heavy chain junction region [Macaca mulatta]